ncbi:MAG: T9SS type A sorting domain-containing protein, partial [Ignavibacteriaceae bacterium]
QWFSSISTDGSGNFVITWGDWRNGDSDIYAQRYSSDGSTLGTNFKVNDDQGSEYQREPSISTDGSGNFVITWTDDRNGDLDIYAQRYSSDGSALGNNYMATNISDSVQEGSNVKLWNGRIYNAWVDNRAASTGYDIWANVLGWNNPVGVEDEETLEIPSAFSLDQNYPNPFNPSTNIRYSIPQSSNVVIKVFDILGNEIETLVNEEKAVGTYEITWYAENLPSGVYFYQLRGGSFVETKKMVLMK